MHLLYMIIFNRIQWCTLSLTQKSIKPMRLRNTQRNPIRGKTGSFRITNNSATWCPLLKTSRGIGAARAGDEEKTVENGGVKNVAQTQEIDQWGTRWRDFKCSFSILDTVPDFFHYQGAAESTGCISTFDCSPNLFLKLKNLFPDIQIQNVKGCSQGEATR